jgi:hypothetical protein
MFAHSMGCTNHHLGSGRMFTMQNVDIESNRDEESRPLALKRDEHPLGTGERSLGDPNSSIRAMSIIPDVNSPNRP